MFYWAQLTLCLLTMAGCHRPEAREAVNYAECLSCHQGIERISVNHTEDCGACHVRPEDRKRGVLKDHQRIVRNPSDPAWVETFCLSCHEEEVRRVQASLHATMAGIINQTRYLWGAQTRAAPARYGLSGPLQPLPLPRDTHYPEKPADLVDDFLRRRCLRCHIHASGMEGPGLYRASGCAACHVIYDHDGCYKGADQAISPSLSGYPARHAFTTRIPNLQCLRCHNQNHVGADYEGWFERDYHRTYRPPMNEGKPALRLYGQGYHGLAPDIHRKRGLWCIDCHHKQDVMGDGRIYSFQMEVPKRTCAQCHGGFARPLPDSSVPEIEKRSGRSWFFSRKSGGNAVLPLFRSGGGGHRIQAHGRLRCSTCHAQWSYQDYGLSVIREDRIEGYRWDGLTAQGDPYLETVMERHMVGPGAGDPVSMDRVSGETRLGIWSQGWRFRRWEFMPLGMDDRSRYAVLRPLYQFRITYVDRLGQVPLDSVIPTRGDGSGRGWAFMPYVPHTIAPVGRSCGGCHKNRVAAGKGVHETLTQDTLLTVPSPPAIKSMRLLSPEEQETLLEPSWKWKKARLRAFSEASQ
jgi:hypothetical protein